ncbi:MAG: transposase, partial [Alphaproteobacteria bacterium]|nr:transposase [Alphaproteobacteria bacterium]
YRELVNALGLTALAGSVLADSRTGKNGWHCLVGLLRQSVYGRLAGYEDVNDADRLGHDPAMRWVVGSKAIKRGAHPPARWVGSRPSFCRRMTISPPSPICRARGLTRYMDPNRSRPSSWNG